MGRPRKQPTEEKPKVFDWTPERTSAVLALAEGKTRKQAATEAQVSETTIYEWLKVPEFLAEMDRLSLMVGIAGRAERLRIAMRVARQKVNEEGRVMTEKDLLDWLKFAQSETDGAKIDAAAFLAALTR
jgi:hypothetical protein